MAREEAIVAYVEGRISRRTLVRRLVAAGVSLGAAASYAQLLDPAFARAHGGGWGDPALHFFARIKIVEENLDHVVNKKRLLIEVQSHRDIPHALVQVFLSRPHEPHGWTDSQLAAHEIKFKGPDLQKFAIPLNYNPPHSVDALKEGKKANLFALFSGSTGGNHSKYALMSDGALLKR